MTIGHPKISSNNLRTLLLATLLVLGNIPLVVRYLGWSFTFIYVVVVLLAFFGLVFIQNFKLNRTILYCIIIAGSVTVQLFCLLFLSSHLVIKMDRVDALVYWQDALLKGTYPYSLKTSLQNPISVFPFLPYLGWPFRILGNIGFLEIFSYLVLVFLLLRHYTSSIDLEFALVVFSTAPILYFEILAKSDLIANVMLIMVLIELIHNQIKRVNFQYLYPTGILLGCIMATRVAIFPVLVIIALYLLRHARIVTTIKIGITALLTFGLLLGPFIWWNSKIFFEFAPLGVNSNKLGTTPLIQFGWILLTAASAFGFGILARTKQQLILGIAITLAIVVSATWINFFLDLSYIEFIYVPLIFLFPQSNFHRSKSYNDS